jgi:hypothetical protein
LIQSSPEPLVSRFQVSHAMLLNVLSRPGDGCAAMQKLIRDSHEPQHAKANLRRRAWELFRALLERKIIAFGPDVPGKKRAIRVNIELQDDFSLDQTLSLYLVDTIKQIDPESPNYHLDVLTLAESIVENPDIILRRQLDRVKRAKIAELKMEGVAYEERLLELDALEYPKPNREFIYSTFNEFAAGHPWVGQENIRPKSIAREMVESCFTFADYIREYDLQKTEGILLRYLTSILKVLAHTVPAAAKNEALEEIESMLRAMSRQVDSSLLEEWERMRDPNWVAKAATSREATLGPAAGEIEDVTRNVRSFTTLVRTELFSILRGLAGRNFEAALESLDTLADAAGENWSGPRLERVTLDFLKEHERILLDNEARNMRHTYIKPAEDRKSWLARQTIVDPEGHNDWTLDVLVDLEKSRATGEAHLHCCASVPLAPLARSREKRRARRFHPITPVHTTMVTAIVSASREGWVTRVIV